MIEYDKSYYSNNSQDRNRPALYFYERFWKKYICFPPVLDFGCGVGFFANRLTRHAEVFGFEINPFALYSLSKNAPKVKLINNIDQLSDESLGSIVALHVLEHIDDNELEYLGENFHRLLKKGGRMLVVIPDLSGSAHKLKKGNWSAYKDETHINLKSASEWKRYFERRWRFIVKICFSDGFYDFPYGKSLFGILFGDIWRALKTFIQFILARPILAVGDGENVIFMLEKQ